MSLLCRPDRTDNAGALLGRMCLLIVALAAGGCASTGAVPQPFPRAGGRGTLPGAAPEADATASALLETALDLTGAPYRNGGTSPAGFDCSGFVWYVFDHHGLELPRTVAQQFRAGRAVGRNELRAGDLVFFDTEGRPATHVGIVVGGDEFVHAPSSRGRVRVERFSSAYWSRRYVGARRVF